MTQTEIEIYVDMDGQEIGDDEEDYRYAQPTTYPRDVAKITAEWIKIVNQKAHEIREMNQNSFFI